MASRTDQLFQDWKRAEAAAKEAERRLAAAVERQQSGGAPPDPDLLAEVSTRRRLAFDRLSAALRALLDDSP